MVLCFGRKGKAWQSSWEKRVSSKGLASSWSRLVAWLILDEADNHILSKWLPDKGWLAESKLHTNYLKICQHIFHLLLNFLLVPPIN